MKKISTHCFGAIFLLLVSFSGVWAQANEAAPGTYQLVFNSRSDEHPLMLTSRELRAIETLRKNDEVVFASPNYSDDIRIRILPRNQINQSGFQPIMVPYYKEEHTYEEVSAIRYVKFD